MQGGSHPAGPSPEMLQSPTRGQQFEIAMWKVSGITFNAKGFVDEVGAVYVPERRESGTNNLFPCSRDRPEGSTAGHGEVTAWHNDADSQDAFDDASEEIAAEPS